MEPLASLPSDLSKKYQQLKSQIQNYSSAIVAFSGGIDSTLVAWIAWQELKEQALAVTSASASLKRDDLTLSQTLTEEWGMPHEIILTKEIDNPFYQKNPTNRCFYCKSSLYEELQNIAKERNISTILNGTNVDDLGDYRPGLQAANDFHVQSPLADCGFTKPEIRALAHHLGIKNFNKPQAACLSSRVPYGTPISRPLLAQIERAETILSRMGFTQFRVRHHEEVARLELLPEEFPLALQQRELLQQRIKDCGYRFVTLDLGGFRSGSLNESLKNRRRKPLIEV